MPRMSAPPASKLLLRRDFAAFFTTQLLGAFNDNLFKNALIIWISSTQASAFGLSPAMMITLCTGVFILPFFLFSATAGQLSDRYEKTPILRVVKGAEILIMGVAAVAFMQSNLSVLLATLFCMGAQSAFIGPLKYSILPQLLAADELLAGNALVETGTFLARRSTISSRVWHCVQFSTIARTSALTASRALLVAYLGSRPASGIPMRVHRARQWRSMFAASAT